MTEEEIDRFALVLKECERIRALMAREEAAVSDGALALRMCLLLLAPRSMLHNEARRLSEEGLFTGVRGRVILRSS